MTKKLDNFDSFDIDDVCKAIENSLGIKYDDEELSRISNLGELCDLTVSKIEIRYLDTCTTQEAFYKIRTAFSETLNIAKNEINPTLEISSILPKKKRIENLRMIEKRLGFKLKLLTPPSWITTILFLTLVFGIILLFVKTTLGLGLVLISILGLEICKDYGKELKVKTFGDLVETAVLYNYSKLRSESNTINKIEIERVVIGLFSNMLDFKKNELARNTTF